MVSKNKSIFCPYCHRFTALSIADGFDTYHQRAEGSSIYFNERGKWWIGECNNCSNCLLIKEPSKDTRDFPLEIYPLPLAKPVDDKVPDFIKEDLKEANKCLSISAYRGVCVLSRRILQIICIDKGAPDGNSLQSQIDWLCEKRVITNDIKEWAHSVRYVGNDGAHPNKDSPGIERADAKDIINLVEQMIQILYISPAIAKSKLDKFKSK